MFVHFILTGQINGHERLNGRIFLFMNVQSFTALVKSLALKAKKKSCNDESSTSGSENEKYTMTVRDLKKFLKRRGR